MAAAIKATKIPAGLQQTLGRVHAATVAVGRGDPEPYMRVWSRAEDVSVFGAWGPCEQGGGKLGRTFRWVATRFGGGDLHCEDVAWFTATETSSPSMKAPGSWIDSRG